MTVNPDTFTYTSPPHLLYDIHKFYTESRTLIFNSPPTPTTHTTSHYAYINRTSVINHFLAYSLSPSYMTHADDVLHKSGISPFLQASHHYTNTSLTRCNARYSSNDIISFSFSLTILKELYYVEIKSQCRSKLSKYSHLVIKLHLQTLLM